LQANDENKEIVRLYDLMGREKSPNIKGELIIFLYSDGTTEKKFIQ
jgi:hypothetical protein